MNQVAINSRIQAHLLDIDKHVAWSEGLLLEQVNFKRVDNGWLAVIKAQSSTESLVAFVVADTLAELFEYTGNFAYKGCLDWKEDKWPSKRAQQNRAQN